MCREMNSDAHKSSSNSYPSNYELVGPQQQLLQPEQAQQEAGGASSMFGPTAATAAAAAAACDGQQGQLHTLLVGGVPGSYTDQDLLPLFKQYGAVQDCSMFRDAKQSAETTRSCALLSYACRSEAAAAVRALHQQLVLPGASQPLTVCYANSQPDDFLADRASSSSSAAAIAQQHRADIPCSGDGSNQPGCHAADSKMQQQDPNVAAAAAARLAQGSAAPEQRQQQQQHSQDQQEHEQAAGHADAEDRLAVQQGPDGEQADDRFTLFFAKVPRSERQQGMLQLFSRFGDVLQLDLFTEYPGAPSSKGCGLVVYGSMQEATAAIDTLANKYTWHGMRSPMVVKLITSNPNKQADNSSAAAVAAAGSHRKPQGHVGQPRYTSAEAAAAALQDPAAYRHQLLYHAAGFTGAGSPGGYINPGYAIAGYANSGAAGSSTSSMMQHEHDMLPDGCASNAYKLFVGNIPRSYTESDLRLVFEAIGPVIEVVVLRDRDTNESKGSGFVWYMAGHHADQAAEQLNMRFMPPGIAGEPPADRPLVVRRASPHHRTSHTGGNRPMPPPATVGDMQCNMQQHSQQQQPWQSPQTSAAGAPGAGSMYYVCSPAAAGTGVNMYPARQPMAGAAAATAHGQQQYVQLPTAAGNACYSMRLPEAAAARISRNNSGGSLSGSSRSGSSRPSSVKQLLMQQQQLESSPVAIPGPAATAACAGAAAMLASPPVGANTGAGAASSSLGSSLGLNGPISDPTGSAGCAAAQLVIVSEPAAAAAGSSYILQQQKQHQAQYVQQALLAVSQPMPYMQQQQQQVPQQQQVVYVQQQQQPVYVLLDQPSQQQQQQVLYYPAASQGYTSTQLQGALQSWSLGPADAAAAAQQPVMAGASGGFELQQQQWQPLQQQQQCQQQQQWQQPQQPQAASSAGFACNPGFMTAATAAAVVSAYGVEMLSIPYSEGLVGQMGSPAGVLMGENSLNSQSVHSEAPTAAPGQVVSMSLAVSPKVPLNQCLVLLGPQLSEISAVTGASVNTLVGTSPSGGEDLILNFTGSQGAVTAAWQLAWQLLQQAEGVCVLQQGNTTMLPLDQLN